MATTTSSQPGFFHRLFGSPSNTFTPSLSGKLVNPRNLPKALTTSAVSDPLRSLWKASPTDEAVFGIYRECVTELARLRDIRVTTVAVPVEQGHLPPSALLSGVVVTIELVVSGPGSRGVYHAPLTTRTVTHTFGECRELLKILSFSIEPNDTCGCNGDRCEYRAAMRDFLSTCWVHPPIVHGTAMQWGGGDGGVAAGIRKSVLTASLMVILAFARGEYGSPSGAAAVSKPPSEEREDKTALPALAATRAVPSPVAVKCRAQLEVAVVVRSFLLCAKDREF